MERRCGHEAGQQNNLLTQTPRAAGTPVRGCRHHDKTATRPEGLEPPTTRFEAEDSIQLSYGRRCTIQCTHAAQRRQFRTTRDVAFQ